MLCNGITISNLWIPACAGMTKKSMIPETTSKLKVVRLTPPGRGAVATVLLHGSNAMDVFTRHWTGPAIESHNRQFFGRFQLDNGRFEEAVVFAAGPEEIEIHCHGGDAVVSAIEAVLIGDGAETVSWQMFFCPNDSQRELAQRFLPLAPTERTAQILLDQFNGALERERIEIEMLDDPVKIQRRRNRLEENARFARHLVEPFRVVLAGPVNAGKSSLLNAVLGFRRAIVDPMPGTTRDTVSGRTALDGFYVEFIDTAGFRQLGSDVEHDLELRGMKRSQQSMDEADLVLWVVDVTDFDADAVPEWGNVLLCLNKIDLIGEKHVPSETVMPSVAVSAVTGDGIETLLDRIIRQLVPDPPKPLEAVPLSELAKIRME